jgi:hypothetical protein
VRKAIVLASALFVAGAGFGLSAAAFAAGAKGTDAKKPAAEQKDVSKDVDATKKDRCELDAQLHLYMGEKKRKFIRECLASKEEPGKAGREPGVVPLGPPGAPRVAPLGAGNPPSTSTGSTAPSNAPVAPSSPVVGSSGTSTTGSSATSISGSSGSSIGSSRSR